MNDARNYTFYIELTDGGSVEWTRLTRAQAVRMYNLTTFRTPDNVQALGWREEKEGQHCHTV
jgi:hypothetical protein